MPSRTPIPLLCAVLLIGALAPYAVADSGPPRPPLPPRAPIVAPNVHISMSEEMIETSTAEEIDEKRRVAERIMNVCSVGSACLNGSTHAELRQAARNSDVTLVLRGTTVTNAVGNRAGVKLYTNSKAEFAAERPLMLDAKRVATGPAKTSVEMKSSNLNCVSASGWGPAAPLVSRQATKKYYQNKSTALAIAKQRAQSRLAREFDTQTSEKVSELQREYEQLQADLKKQGVPIEEVQTRTVENRLWIDALLAAEAPSSAFQVVPSSADVITAVHQTVADQSVKTNLGGKKLTNEDLESKRQKLFEQLGAKADEVESSTPWSVTFADVPMVVRWDDGSMKVTMQIAHFVSEGRNFPDDMTIETTYHFEKAGGKIEAVREQPLVVYPTQFPPGKARIPGRLLTQRTILRRRFEAVMPERMEVRPTMKPTDSSTELVLSDLHLEDGWVQTDWQRAADTN